MTLGTSKDTTSEYLDARIETLNDIANGIGVQLSEVVNQRRITPDVSFENHLRGIERDLRAAIGSTNAAIVFWREVRWNRNR